MTDTTTAAQQAEARSARATRNPWVPASVVMVATTMVALDTTIVNVALHDIGTDLEATSSSIEWVVSAYLLAVCVSQPVTGWLADRFGRRAVFLSSLAAFTTASLACALSPSLGMLILFRVLQGLGGGALVPVGMAIMLDAFPKERHGRALATWGMAAMVAPGLGPTLGGWLSTSVSWHWLFLVNVPIGVVAIVAGLRLVPELGHREDRPFDVAGLVLGCGGLALAVLGLTEANGWGWGSPATVLCLVAGVGALVGFVRHELRTTTPMIELRMFSERSFRLAIGTMLLVVTAQFGRLVYIPLALESLRGYSALRVGVLFLPAGVVSAFSMQWGGRMSDRLGPRTPILIGTAIMFVAVAGFGTLTLHTSPAVIAGFMALQGLGLGFITAPAMVAGLSSLPAHLVAQGTAVRSLTSQVGGALAVAVLGAVVAARMGDAPSPAHAQAAYNSAFVVAAAGMAFAGFLAWRLPRTVPQREGARADVLAMAAE